MRTASLTAGIALLLMSVVAIFGNVVVVDGLVTEGDAAATAADITASAGMFRLGIASLIVVIALDVVIAWALYRVFSPVNRAFPCWQRSCGWCTRPSSWSPSASSSA